MNKRKKQRFFKEMAVFDKRLHLDETGSEAVSTSKGSRIPSMDLVCQDSEDNSGQSRVLVTLPASIESRRSSSLAACPAPILASLSPVVRPAAAHDSYSLASVGASVPMPLPDNNSAASCDSAAGGAEALVAFAHLSYVDEYVPVRTAGHTTDLLRCAPLLVHAIDQMALAVFHTQRRSRMLLHLLCGARAMLQPYTRAPSVPESVLAALPPTIVSVLHAALKPGQPLRFVQEHWQPALQRSAVFGSGMCTTSQTCHALTEFGAAVGARKGLSAAHAVALVDRVRQALQARRLVYTVCVFICFGYLIVSFRYCCAQGL